MIIREYKPEGFSNWTAYYQHKAKVAKIKQFCEYVFGVVLILGVIAAVDYIFNVLRSLQ